MPIDYGSARALLEATFAEAESDLLHGSVAKVRDELRSDCEILFNSRTQAYREVLLGCIIARIQDGNTNIRQPYADQGPLAFSGRSLDERVINPFLQAKRIPSSKGPYLSVFRRSVQFDASIRGGLRDKSGYDAFLDLIAFLESTSEDSELLQFLKYLLYKFAELREAANVPISQLRRISLEQCDSLLSSILSTPSGGRFPVFLVVAAFTAIKESFQLDWDIAWQGINVADAASGAGGDITITRDGQILLAAEVTERPVDKTRVDTTFTTKIAPYGIEDYLFFVDLSRLTPEARQQARQYFSLGHEVNFVEIKSWILMLLATVGQQGRTIFLRAMVDLLSASDVPRTLKVSWNDQIANIALGQG